MSANDDFDFLEALGDGRTLDAVLNTVDGMEPHEGLYLLNVVRAIDALGEANAVTAEINGAERIGDTLDELIAHVQEIAKDINERED